MGCVRKTSSELKTPLPMQMISNKTRLTPLTCVLQGSVNSFVLRRDNFAISGLPEYCTIFHFPSSVLRHRRDMSTFLDDFIVKTMKTMYFLNAHQFFNAPVKPSTAKYSSVQPYTYQHHSPHSPVQPKNDVQPTRLHYSTLQPSTA